MSQYIIQTRDLTKTYGEQKSVSNLNMHVRKGKIYGLLGRNGAGKTTTMKMLLNLIEPTSGSIRIFNRDIRLEEKKILPRIGSLIESPGFYPNLTGTENLRIFAKLRGIPRTDAIEQALKLVNLPYKDKKLYSQYSLGMKQRLAIALAVMHDPEILILDEPINGLDPIGIAEIRTFIEDLSKNRGKTILISSHILSEIAVLADDIGIIDKGVLIEEGSMKELEEYLDMLNVGDDYKNFFMKLPWLFGGVEILDIGEKYAINNEILNEIDEIVNDTANLSNDTIVYINKFKIDLIKRT